MATVEECEAALGKIAGRLDAADPSVRGKIDDERVLACQLSDLDVTFVAQLRGGGLHDIRQAPAPAGAVTMTMTSDDLVAMTEGRLGMPAAFAAGRLKINASFADLLRLRSFF